LDALRKIRRRIAARVRELRQARKWTQAELAERLELSQSRLSELERGAGSFSAEQLLLLAQLFNVAPSEFAGIETRDEHAELQNALARHGAVHLRESEDVLPRAELDATQSIRDALVAGIPRLVSAVAPVLVLHIDKVSLSKLRSSLAEAGFDRRLWWLLENVHAALQQELSASPPREWARRYRRAAVILEAELEAGRALRPAPNREWAPQVLDPSIRSTKTRKQVESSGSEISRRWGIVTGLHPEDFARALEAARVPRGQ
jgi:transcriptional regulator with XRE-family HTH domain